MTKILSKKNLYISYTNEIQEEWDLLKDYNFNYNLIKDNKTQNLVFYINKDFYNKNKLYNANLIKENLKNNDIENIILNSFEFLNILPLNDDNKTSFKNLYITENCELNSNELFKYDIHKHFKNIIFEKNIDVELANKLYKNNITFKTLDKYSLLDSQKFSANNYPYTFSDYYYLNNLTITNPLSENDLNSLKTFFDFNKNLANITLNCNMKTALDVVNLYTKCNSKYLLSNFNIVFDKIILSKADRQQLYLIDCLLNFNHSNLNLIFGKEIISAKDYFNTINPLIKYSEKIKNKSPLEKLVLIEDYTKVKPYKDSSNKNVSRRFFSSLNSDYVVCFTYAYTFKTLCDLCGINSTILNCKIDIINNTVSEHAKIICNINDKKYNYNGFLIFDPTYDAMDKKSDFEDEKPTDNFLFFGNTFNNSIVSNYHTTNEFGLLNIAKNGNTFDKFENIEASKQINELIGTNVSPYNKQKELNAEYVISLNNTINKIKNSKPLELEKFKTLLKSARQGISPISEYDIERIVDINTYKSINVLNPNSDNMFLKNSTKKLKIEFEDIKFDCEF